MTEKEGKKINKKAAKGSDKKTEKSVAKKSPEVNDRWENTPTSVDDPLLLCLETLSHIFDRPMSTTAFKAGLPLSEGKLTPDLFVRSAARAGLNAQIVRKKLKNVSQLTLPAVLLLEGNKACILVKLTDKDAEVVFPEMGRGVRKIKLEDLNEIYVGISIFVSVQYRYDARSSNLDVEGPKSWFWGTLKQYWPIYAQVGLAAILVNLFAIVGPLFTMNVYDRVVPNGEQAWDTLRVLAIGVIIVYTFDFLLKVLRAYFVDSAGKNADVILASRLFEQVMGIKMAARPQSSGGFANQLREYETLREFFSSVTLVALIDLPFVLLFIWVIYLIGGPVAYVQLAAVPIVIFVSVIMQFPLQAWVARMFREAAQKHSLLVEAINGLETIKSLGVEGKIQRNWERFVEQSSGSSKSAKFVSTIAINFTAFIQQLCTVAVIIVGVYWIFEGEMSMGGLIACSILSGRALAPLGQIVGLLTRFNQSIAALESLDEVIGMPVERPKDSMFLHRPQIEGEIEFRNVTFKYPGQQINALDNVSFKAEPGEKIGLIGRIGSGKTTIEKLVLGLYDAEEGSVLIDGTDTRTMDPAELRSNIGYIPQDVFLFFGSVRENIAMGSEDTTDEDIIRASKIGGVDEFVRRHPMGYDMPVGESGREVSGGQRQSIAVARSLVRDPPILIFDEPTAMMDHASEARFLQKIKTVLGDKTLLLITHRMSLLAVVDRIIIVDNGKIVADGPRDDVLKALSGSQIRSAGS